MATWRELPYSRGDFAAAAKLLDECLSLHRALGNAQGVSYALRDKGLLALEQGDIAGATPLFDEHLARMRALGDAYCQAIALLCRGDVPLRQGDYRQAESFYEESLAISRRLDARVWVGFALGRLGVLAVLGGAV